MATIGGQNGSLMNLFFFKYNIH